MGRGYGNLMCTVVQDLPEQLLLTPATPGPVMEPCRRRRYRKGVPVTHFIHAPCWHPNGGFPDCFTFSSAPLLRLSLSLMCFTTLDGSSSA